MGGAGFPKKYAPRRTFLALYGLSAEVKLREIVKANYRGTGQVVNAFAKEISKPFFA